MGAPPSSLGGASSFGICRHRSVSAEAPGFGGSQQGGFDAATAWASLSRKGCSQWWFYSRDRLPWRTRPNVVRREASFGHTFRQRDFRKFGIRSWPPSFRAFSSAEFPWLRLKTSATQCTRNIRSRLDVGRISRASRRIWRAVMLGRRLVSKPARTTSPDDDEGSRGSLRNRDRGWERGSRSPQIRRAPVGALLVSSQLAAGGHALMRT